MEWWLLRMRFLCVANVWRGTWMSSTPTIPPQPPHPAAQFKKRAKRDYETSNFSRFFSSSNIYPTTTPVAQICAELLCWSLDTSYKKLKWMFGEILCFWGDPAAAAALLSGWRCSLSDLNNFANKQHIYHQVLLLSSFYFPFPRHNSHILEAIASTMFLVILCIYIHIHILMYKPNIQILHQYSRYAWN